MRTKSCKISRFILLLWLINILLSPSAWAFASRLDTPEVNTDLSELPEQVAEKLNAIKQATELIYKGDFELAGEFVEQSIYGEPNDLAEAGRQLLQYVNDYNEINEHGRLARETSYSEYIDKLDEQRENADTNDVNGIVDVLVAVANVSQVASHQQRQELLSDSFIRETQQKAIAKASEYEAQGKWLEAYSNCYYLLTAMDPNNEEYEEYAESLYDKAVIEASLENSPCETREERYSGVKKEMFAWAISHLELYYVNDIDYTNMVVKAVDRCRMLSEVLKYKIEDINDITENKNIADNFEDSLSIWLEGLDMLSSQALENSEQASIDSILLAFENILRLNDATLALPEALVITHFTEAALETLDPYTVVVWPTQVEPFEKTMTQEFSGIGVLISKPNNQLTISSLLPDTPAYNAGLDAGDIIEAVDGIDTKDMSLNCAVKKITGPKGTKVNLRIRRPGAEDTEDVAIVRNTIVVSTIYGWQRSGDGKWHYMLDQENKIGYVRVSNFSATTASDLGKTLDKLEAEGLRGLILDLRDNSGGLLESAVDLSDMFLSEGLIVSSVPGPGRLPTYKFATEKGTRPDYPLVILVNSDSASASEILAGALADEKYERAVLVGARTLGKGSVQGITRISGGAEIKYTIAYYHLPSGQKVESREAMEKLGRKDWGIAPDIRVVLSNSEIIEMREVQRDNDVLAQANHDNTANEIKKHSLEETLASDRQLAIALLAVKSKLVQQEAIAMAFENNEHP